MTTLEVELRVSIIRVELAKLAEQLEPARPKAARILRYAVGVLNLCSHHSTR